MMKVTMIIGEPAVGKSRLMREILDRLGPTTYHRIPYIMWHEAVDSTIVLGDYSDPAQKYPGTDRMSMACQPKVIQQIMKWQNAGKKAVIFEGDRLGNDKMIKSLQYTVNLEVIHVITSRLQERQAARTDQSNSFQASRRTKIRNMTGPNGRLAHSGHVFRTIVHDMPSETAYHAEQILAGRY